MAQKETIPDPVPSASVPVPATLALVGIGIAGLVATRRNKRK
ncbi:PEP-CTERM sorting domain-containing protein [Congregibacter sp.]